MSDDMTVCCPECSFAYSLTREYVHEFGGGTTNCTECGNPFLLPEVHAFVPDAPDRGVEEAPAPEPAPIPEPAAVLPYASAPVKSSNGEAAPTLHGGWSDGSLVVVTRGGAMPPRCVTCGEKVAGLPKRISLRWLPPEARYKSSWIMRFAMTEKIGFRAYYCDRHWRRQQVFTVVSVLLLLLGFGLFGGANSLHEQQKGTEYVVLVAAAGLLALVGICMFVAVGQGLKVVSADTRFAWIGGCGPYFIRKLPTIESVRSASAAATAERLNQVGDSQA
jgi:hypothetical protein